MKKKKMDKGLATMPEPMKDGGEDDYVAHSMYDTLERAHHIKKDGEKMKRVKMVAGRKMKSASALHASLGLEDMKPEIKSVSDLKKLAKSMREKSKLS